MAESLDDGSHFKCAICLSFYTEPRLLSCYHIFCTPCLETLTSARNNAECPLCRWKIVLPKEGIRGFKVYPSNESLDTSEIEELELCGLCRDEKRAVAKCTDCDVSLCFECHAYHRKLKMFTNHKTEQKNTPQNEESDRRLVKLCDQHKKELEIFCLPCNKLICTECHDNEHYKHRVQRKDVLAQMKRDILLAKNASLKSRIPILENVLEQAKLEENSYYKLSNQMKKEIQSYALGLKEVFCRAVDYLAQEQKQIIDRTQKTDIKIIQTYQGELETEIMSLLQFTETLDNIIKTSTDHECLNEALKLEIQLDQNLGKSGTSMATINVIKFEYGDFMGERIPELFGGIKISNTKVIKPSFENVPIYEPISRTTPSKINSFKGPDKVLGIVSAKDDTVWVLTTTSLNMYNSDGTVMKSYKSPENCKRLLRKSVDEIWVWCEDRAIKGTDITENGYKVSFEDGTAGCFIDTENLIVYNPADKYVYVIEKNGAIKRKIENEELQKLLNDKDIVIAETKNSNLVFAQFGEKIIITDHNGSVLNTYEYVDARFEAITSDNYGNILVADSSDWGFIDVLSEHGVFIRELLSNKNKSIKHDVYGIRHAAIDECGNLWFSNGNGNIVIYSYI